MTPKKMSNKSNPTKTKPRPRLEMVPATDLPDNSSLKAMFKTGLSSGMKVKSRSPMLKPDKFPTGQILSGIIKRLITCEAHRDKDKVKSGCLIEIVPEWNAVGVAIPAVTTIMTALEITSDGDNGMATIYSTPYIGHRVEIEKLPERLPSKQGNAAWNFLVAVSEEKEYDPAEQ